MSLANTEGAKHLAAFYEMARNGFTPGHTGSGLVADMIAYGYTVAQTTCNASFLAEQSLSVNCLEDGTGLRVRSNMNCLDCLRRVKEVMDARDQLEKDAHSANRQYVTQTLSGDLKAQIEGPDGTYAAGACQYVCNQCVVENINQNFQLQVKSTCDVSNPNFASAFAQGIKLQAQATLDKYQDAFQATTTSPTSTPGSGSGNGSAGDTSFQNSASQSISDTLTEFFDTEKLTSLQSQVVAVQAITVEPGSTSLVLARVNQHASVAAVASLVEGVLDAQQPDGGGFYQDVIQSNQQNLQLQSKIRDLFKALTETLDSLRTLLNTTLGQLMASLLALLILMGLGLGLVIKFRLGMGPENVSEQTEKEADQVIAEAGAGKVALAEEQDDDNDNDT